MKKLLFALMGISTLLLGSCANETWRGNVEPDVPAGKLRVLVGMEGMVSQEGLTRVNVAAEQYEDQIESLYLLFFESTTDNTGKFVDYVTIDPQGVGIEHDIDMSGTQLEVTDAYHILAVANIHGDFGKHYLNGMSVEDWMLQWADKQEKEVIAAANAWTRTGMTVAPSQLLMSGRAAKPANTFSVTIPLVRNQVRFDVLSDVKNKYEVASVEIRNAYPSSKIWNDGSADGPLDYTDNTGRIQSYYKFVNNSTNNPKFVEYAGDIMGGLYAFENRVAKPERNDRYTTDLIIELKEIATGTSYFYRVNIVPEAEAQTLKRNNAYRVNINSVVSDGSTTADEAYNNANDSGLDVTINTWDMPSSGIMVTDNSSLLSSPYETVTLDRATILSPGVEGVVSTSFQIYTVTSNPNPVAPLTIVSQTYSYNNSDEEPAVNAVLNGNILTVTANPILSGVIVTGEIKLGYAGLRATIKVVQTDQTVDFLQVHLPDGGIPTFAPFGGIPSGMLRVEASGPWTATILSETGGFTFAENGAAGDLELLSTEAENGRFRIWTFGANTEPALREAVIMVSLDSDPVNYVEPIRVVQSVAAGIAIVPSHAVTFDGTGALAAIPNNDTRHLNVRPSQTGDPGEFAAWTASITGPDAAMFDCTPQGHEILDTTNPEGNWVEVAAVGKNTSGLTYNAKLTVTLVNSGTTTASIDLVQHSSSIDFAPNTVPAVAKTGGETQPIAIQADASLMWEVLSFTTTGTGGKFPLSQHAAELVLDDDSNTPVTAGTQYSVATDKFKVSFPKIYYPNRETNISATVEIGIVGSTLKKSFIVSQTPLTPAPMVGYGMAGVPDYGDLTDTYARGWNGVSGGVGLAQIPGYRTLGEGSINVTTINPSVNYLHVVPHISGTAGQNYNWSAVNNYIETRDAWTVIFSQDDNGRGPINNTNSPLKKAGYGNSEYGRDINGQVYTGQQTSRVYQFVFNHGKSPLNPASIGQYFYIDGVNTSLAISEVPASGVVLISKESPDTGRAMLVVDIAHKFIWCGESQMFWYEPWLTLGRGTMLDNLMYLVANASKYGSHFTDLLLETGIDLGDGRKSQPALWDTTYWGRDVIGDMTK